MSGILYKIALLETPPLMSACIQAAKSSGLSLLQQGPRSPETARMTRPDAGAEPRDFLGMITTGDDHKRVSKNGGPPNRPQYTMIPITRTSKTGPLSFETPITVSLRVSLSPPTSGQEAIEPWADLQVFRAPKEHRNIRILQHMISGIPLMLAVEPKWEILLFMWSLGPLNEPNAQLDPAPLRHSQMEVPQGPQDSIVLLWL